MYIYICIYKLFAAPGAQAAADEAPRLSTPRAQASDLTGEGASDDSAASDAEGDPRAAALRLFEKQGRRSRCMS